VEIFLVLGIKAGAVCAREPERVRGKKGLAESNEGCAFGGGVGDGVNGLLDRRFATKKDWCDLGQGGFHNHHPMKKGAHGAPFGELKWFDQAIVTLSSK
jgi:hypothetical protein